MKKKNRPAGGRQSQYARIEIAEQKGLFENGNAGFREHCTDISHHAQNGIALQAHIYSGLSAIERTAKLINNAF